MGSANNCMVPNNDSNNIYFTQNCGCNFTADRYDHHIAGDRISLEEVQGFLDEVNVKHKPLRNRMWKWIVWYLIFIFIWAAGSWTVMLTTHDTSGCKDPDDHDPSHCD